MSVNVLKTFQGRKGNVQKRAKCCRILDMYVDDFVDLKNVESESFIAKFRFDTAENEPSKLAQCIVFAILIN